jgi:hypothetical protein
MTSPCLYVKYSVTVFVVFTGGCGVAGWHLQVWCLVNLVRVLRPFTMHYRNDGKCPRNQADLGCWPTA